MKWEQISKLKNTEFRRLTGIKRKTFNVMLEILKVEEDKKLVIGGRPSKLVLEERLLMALEYWREYRTYFHIAQNYGITESASFKIIRKIEDCLIKSGKFSLPKRKDKLTNEDSTEILILDATESPVERPKKKIVKTFKNNTIQVKRNNIQQKPNY